MSYFKSLFTDYVLSKEALRRLNAAILSDKCGAVAKVNETLSLEKCMENAEVQTHDKSRLSVEETERLFAKETNYFRSYIRHPKAGDSNDFTNTLVSFHYNGDNDMIMFDFLMNHVQIYGTEEE